MRTLSRFITFSFLLLLLGVSAAQAFTFRLSQQDLNQVVGVAFPQTQYYQGIKVVFSNPYVHLRGDNKVAVDVDLNGTQDGQVLNATAKLSGEVFYDGTAGELQIIRPRLDDFKVIDSTLKNESDIRQWAEQFKGQSAPMILLLDFRSLNLSLLGNRVPTAMRVESGQLVVDF